MSLYNCSFVTRVSFEGYHKVLVIGHCMHCNLHKYMINRHTHRQTHAHTDHSHALQSIQWNPSIRTPLNRGHLFPPQLPLLHTFQPLK